MRKGVEEEMKNDPEKYLPPFLPFFIAVLIWIVIFVFCFRSCAKAETIDINEEKLADAIYKAENSVKYPYGIKSINTNGNKEYARKICLNTIRNQKKRHAKHNCGLDFIKCLSKRYAPIGALDDPNKLNINWLKNVRYFLAKG